MAGAETVGSIAELWRFPVKSMGGERLERAQLTERGLLGDRAYALIETDTGKVVSAKNVRSYPGLLSCRAAFVEPPKAGRELPPVRIALPGGEAVTSDSRDADRVLSSFFGRAVTLARSAPADFTIDNYSIDVEDADSGGRHDTAVELKLGAAFFAEAGLASPVAADAFFDLFPLSVLTTSTLARLEELEPASRFDPRRFRMNVIVSTRESGFVENAWVGHGLAIGATAKLRVTLADPRCAMTTLAQGDLAEDRNVLRALARHNRIEVGGATRYPCAGVYAVLTTAGTVGTGDNVALD